eukprot:TRINITY_DN1404_c0_g1_i1.p1 TRINITY_DN1404_c0_g1~~TRINITY_DN1404_c0_g1_i1.p1  ORF type:complete len:532 (-),score=110.16 TRINITY_DN1404_c0_g1_i1:402-1997(-)
MTKVVSNNDTLACAALVSDTVDGLIADIAKAKEVGADLVDLRLDNLKEFNVESDLKKLLEGRLLPAIVSFRPKSDGGLYEGDEGARIAVLQKALALGAEYVDVELKVAEAFIKAIPEGTKGKVIVSSHNFESTPSLEELEKTVSEIKATGANIVKVVTKAQDICDCKRIFDLLEKKEGPLIAFALGIRGEITRELAPKYGAFLTYGGLIAYHESSKENWKPPSIQELLDSYLLRRVSKDTLVFGVCADPVGHSKSPLLLNAAMVETGVDGVYVPFLVEKTIAEFFDTFDTFAGFSVTLPHKSAACERCEEVDPTAKAIGAVNNVVRRPDKTLYARNTDWGACTSAIEDGLREKEGLPADGPSPLNGRLLILCGAGGAGRALAFGSTQQGAILVVADLDQDRAKELAGIFNGGTCTVADVAIANSAAVMRERFAPTSTKAPVLAHMTPVGMIPNVDRTLFTKEMLGGYAVVFDAVYTPPETRLLKEAKAAGCTPVGGVEMFVRQGADQFFNFTGRMPSKDIMRDVLLAGVSH